MLAQSICYHRVTGLVYGYRVALSFDVLRIIREAVLLQVLGMDHVGPPDGVSIVSDGYGESLVDHVLDRGTGGICRDQ